MKALLTTLLISAFVGIAVFGVFAMNHSGDVHGGCIASAANGASCPDESNPFASIAFHIDAFNSFSTATIVSITINLLAIVLLFRLWLSFSVLSLVSGKQSFSARQFLERQRVPLKEQFIHWLALHENSPSAL